MKKIPQQVFTAEFKELAVQRTKDGQMISAVGRELGVSHQTVRNWVKGADAGKPTDQPCTSNAGDNSRKSRQHKPQTGRRKTEGSSLVS